MSCIITLLAKNQLIQENELKPRQRGVDLRKQHLAQNKGHCENWLVSKGNIEKLQNILVVKVKRIYVNYIRTRTDPEMSRKWSWINHKFRRSEYSIAHKKRIRMEPAVEK